MSCIILGGLYTKNVSAISSNIVISQIKLGDAPPDATNEFIELYNNNTDDVDITNWCLHYASAGSVEIGNKLSCFVVENKALHIFIPGHAFIFAVSSQLASSSLIAGSDLTFSATLSGAAGHVRLVDDHNFEVDKVGWGAAAKSAEAEPAEAPPVGSILQRKTGLDMALIDTDNNYSDFEVAAPKPSYTYGALYEVQDICLNIDEIQNVVPKGYTTDIEGNCYSPPVDVCLNIDNLQIIVPDGYALDDSGDCINMDICLNLAGVQLLLPPSYKLASDSLCLLDLLPLQITEMLPNAAGDDNGREFIELYNPNDVAVDLTYYKLGIGLNHEKLYSFLEGSNINPGSYAIFSNDDINFKLVNTSSQVTLMSADNNIIDTADAYGGPADGLSWALIDDTWQYTNQSTPGLANLASLLPATKESKVATELAPCAPNQYRSPETNRCRQIIVASSTLTPCKDGQYRSEQTNRCRNIASNAVALTPCAAGEERNPATNRCRSVLGAATERAPCAAGEERNPATNRCRKVVSTIPAAGFAVDTITDASGDMAGWWAFGGVSTLALGYAGWEWRAEAAHLLRKIGSFFQSSK